MVEPTSKELYYYHVFGNYLRKVFFMARQYKNFHVYVLAYDFVFLVYAKTNSFPKSEEQNITSQLRRAAVSFPLNIAEGSAKASGKEFAYFLNVSYASAKEVEVLISLCKDFGFYFIPIIFCAYSW